MAYGAAPTESGSAKLHFLTPDGNSPAGYFAVDTGTTGTGSNSVGFLGMATHVHDDPAGSPGGLSTTSVPIVLVGGVRDDALGGLTPVAGDAAHLLVDANGALWTHDNALDAALSGAELQVDIVASLPAGTNEIGKLAAGSAEIGKLGTGTAEIGNVKNSGTFAVQSTLQTGNNVIGRLASNDGVDIGNVDVTQVIAGTGATSLGKAVDSAPGGTDTGVAALVLRDDTLTTLTPVDGDYVHMRVNSTGALHVTGGGGGTEYAVDDALGANPTGSVSLAKRDDALGGLTPAEGDAVELRVDTNGALWTHDNALGAVLDGNYLNVNANIAGTDILGGAGAVAGGVQRVTLASDDRAVTALELIDNTVDGNYLNVNANIAGTDFAGGAGAVAAGVQRVTLASDDRAVAALELIDNAVDGAYLNVNANIAGTDFVGGAGTVAGGVQRVTLASNDPGVVLLGTIDSDTDAIKTAVQLLDDAVYVDDADWTDGSSKHLLVGGLYQSSEQTITNGDVGPLAVDANGRLKISIEADNAGIGGGTEYTDDTDTHSTGSSKGKLFMAAATPSDGSVDANDIGALAMSTDRRLHVDAQIVGIDSALDVSGATVTVDLSSNNDVTIDSSSIVLAEDAAHGDGDAGVMLLAVRRDSASSLVNADNDYIPLTTDADGTLYVNIRDGGNTITVDGTITASNTAGDKAHDAADGSVYPIKIGGRAQEPTAQPDEVANDDRVDALFDRNGYQRIRGDFVTSQAKIEHNTSGNNEIVAAQAAGKRIAVWAILIVSDGTTDVRWEDGADAGGGQGAFTGQIPLQVREGYSISSGGLTPLFVGSAATALNLELNAAVLVHGFVSYSVIDD